MILNVNISCSSWGIIGGFEIFKASMKLRLINAAIHDLGVKLGVLFYHVPIHGNNAACFFYFIFYNHNRKRINDRASKTEKK
jgi:hypothetical protein